MTIIQVTQINKVGTTVLGRPQIITIVGESTTIVGEIQPSLGNTAVVGEIHSSLANYNHHWRSTPIVGESTTIIGENTAIIGENTRTAGCRPYF